MILTSQLCAKHPFASQNTQHMDIWLDRSATMAGYWLRRRNMCSIWGGGGSLKYESTGIPVYFCVCEWVYKKQVIRYQVIQFSIFANLPVVSSYIFNM